jgi:Family of unknown function (DUF6011)
MTTTTAVRLASAKQLTFLLDLLKSRPGPVADGVLTEINFLMTGSGELVITSVVASRWIDALTRVRPSTPTVPHPTVPTVGSTVSATAPVAPPVPPVVPVPSPRPVVSDSSMRTDCVPDGKYALVIDGVVKNYYVETITKGRWTGWCFPRLFVSDNFKFIKGRERHQILDLIAEGPEEAARLFGRENVHCPFCHRKLTLQRSKDAGIGPICAQKKGWAY